MTESIERLTQHIDSLERHINNMEKRVSLRITLMADEIEVRDCTMLLTVIDEKYQRKWTLFDSICRGMWSAVFVLAALYLVILIREL